MYVEICLVFSTIFYRNITSNSASSYTFNLLLGSLSLPLNSRSETSHCKLSHSKSSLTICFCKQWASSSNYRSESKWVVFGSKHCRVQSKIHDWVFSNHLNSFWWPLASFSYVDLYRWLTEDGNEYRFYFSVFVRLFSSISMNCLYLNFIVLYFVSQYNAPDKSGIRFGTNKYVQRILFLNESSTFLTKWN